MNEVKDMAINKLLWVFISLVLMALFFGCAAPMPNVSAPPERLAPPENCIGREQVNFLGGQLEFDIWLQKHPKAYIVAAVEGVGMRLITYCEVP